MFNKLKSKKEYLQAVSSAGGYELKMAEDLFILYPVFEHPDDGDIMELDFDFSSHELNK